MYDPSLGRFHVVDRFAEKYISYTPYHYTLNNPILFVDINGDSTDVYFFDQEDNPEDKSEYTADVYVETEDGTVNGPYEGSTYPNAPDSQNEHNTVDEGSHLFNNASGHKLGSKKGLNLVDENGSRTNTPGKDKDGNEVKMIGANVHGGYKEDNRGSAGCPTIHPKDEDAFMGNFDWSANTQQTKGNTVGTTYIYRGTSTEATNARNLLEFKQKIQNMSLPTINYSQKDNTRLVVPIRN